jgi:predicted permease
MRQNKLFGIVLLVLGTVVMATGIFLTAQRQQAMAMVLATGVPTASLMLQMAAELIFWVILVAASTAFLLMYGASFYVGEFVIKSKVRT